MADGNVHILTTKEARSKLIDAQDGVSLALHKAQAVLRLLHSSSDGGHREFPIEHGEVCTVLCVADDFVTEALEANRSIDAIRKHLP